MAIQQHDREDLLGSGLAMPLRGELEINGVTLLVGFRSDGQVSLYCGTDPVFQFNGNSQLRRVFFQGRRIAAEGGRLMQLEQGLLGGKVRFQRQPVDQSQADEILAVLRRWLSDLRQAVDQQPGRWRPDQWRVVEPEPGALHKQLRTWLCELPDPPEIASSPNA